MIKHEQRALRQSVEIHLQQGAHAHKVQQYKEKKTRWFNYANWVNNTKPKWNNLKYTWETIVSSVRPMADSQQERKIAGFLGTR